MSVNNSTTYASSEGNQIGVTGYLDIATSESRISGGSQI